MGMTLEVQCDDLSFAPILQFSRTFLLGIVGPDVLPFGRVQHLRPTADSQVPLVETEKRVFQATRGRLDRRPAMQESRAGRVFLDLTR